MPAKADQQLIVELNQFEYDYLPAYLEALMRGDVPETSEADFITDALRHAAEESGLAVGDFATVEEDVNGR